MEEYDIACPYCGEKIGILIDASIPQQQYVEDCQVCCAPIVFSVVIDAEGTIEQVSAVQEND